jgi:AraC-like DNA-binding protein
LRWIIDRIAAERSGGAPGCDVACAQLAQLLFVQVLRAHLASAEALPPGWLRAMRDPHVLRALRELHAAPARDWKLSDLAKAAAMSRTAFALRFKAVVGVAPVAYLTAWRMRLAQRALREEDVNVAELAAQLGYGSESAFSHAFKREVGVGPRAYRWANARTSNAAE